MCILGVEKGLVEDFEWSFVVRNVDDLRTMEATYHLPPARRCDSSYQFVST
jgi:hypothetical protein